ncbi:hypothetical protein HOY82DRAFT_578819 [Tuber indicum]|nr:hypothetical protein HOY82DRAFT_578819 [Tuber indicum]
MLPPISPETLSANPLFSTLYTDLTTNHLNPDASTPLSVFHDNIQPIAHDISLFLDRSAKDLVSLVQPDLDVEVGAGGGGVAMAIDHLPANAARLRTQIFANHQSLVAQRGRLGRLILEVADGYAAFSLRALSHSASDGGACGALQKGTLAKAMYLSLLAESMRGKVGVVRFDALGEVYDEEAVGALENYRVHLTDTNLRLVARKRVAEGELERYGAAGADMAGLVERYAALLRRIESVGRDIRRLGGTV